MRLPMISGVLADNTAEFGSSYPVNLEIVAVDNKIAKAQFRSTSGATPFAVGPGIDRGGYFWRDTMFRVMGTKLVAVFSGGGTTVLGDVGGTGPVGFAESFDRLAIRSSGKLFYYDGAVNQVTDVDLGEVKDLIWVDGYFMTTDGENVVVTELSDPTAVLPLKYGSAEEDPDEVTGLIKVGNEPNVLNRHTIQVFKNVGGNGFPFATIKGATIPVGCVGADAKCLFADTFAFVGSGRNEALGVYLAGNGSAQRISTRKVDDELAKVADPKQIVLESRTSRAERRLFVHLPTKTLVFLFNATRALGEDVWYEAISGFNKPYRLRNAVQAFGKTYVGDTESTSVGELTDAVNTHFGEIAEWRFDVGVLYNEAKGGVINWLELVGLPGRAPFGVDGTAWLSMTVDGQTFSVERPLPMGKAGQFAHRLRWYPGRYFSNWIGLRFRGYSAAMPGFAGLEAEIKPMAA